MVIVFINGKEVSFEERFPDIKELKIDAEECSIGSLGNKKVLNKEDLGIIEPCNSGVCDEGGFDLDTFVSMMNYKKETFKEGSIKCKGYEKMGGGNKRECPNFLDIKVNIKYKKKK